MTGLAPDTVLLGPVSLDRYVQQQTVLPGGGALNIAFHWAERALPFHLLTRVGDDHPEVFVDFLLRHRIEHSAGSIIGRGESASIDIVMGDDRQPWMDNFSEGVWTDFRLTTDEEAVLATARRLHVVLVDPAVREVQRLGLAGGLDRLAVSGDFLSFRHYTVERFAETMTHLDLGFVGWPGDRADPTVAAIGEVAFDLRRLVVVTMGSRGVLVFDGRNEQVERFVPVDALPVAGTTVGCGDAFIAAFLATWWTAADRDGNLDRALDLGKRAGALATTWIRPLPDTAYVGGAVGASGETGRGNGQG